jgi:hypothetical protein
MTKHFFNIPILFSILLNSTLSWSSEPDGRAPVVRQGCNGSSLKAARTILAGWPFVGIFCTWIEHLLQTELSQSRITEMDAHLPSLDQLRNNAAECIRLAEAARTSRQKSLFIEMAERWLTLAEHAAKTQAR